MAWNGRSVINALANVEVGASQTLTELGRWKLSKRENALNQRITIMVTSATVAADIVFTFQQSFDSGITWVTVKTEDTLTTTASAVLRHITFNVEVAADQAYAPLSDWGRLCVTTGIGDKCVCSNIRVFQDW